MLVSPCGTHPTFEGNRRRVLSLAMQLQHLGHRVHLALLPNAKFTLGDLAAMRQHWGDRLHLLYPADHWTMGFRLRRQAARWIARLARQPASGTAARLTGVDEFYLDWWNVQLALLQRRLHFDAVCAEYVFVSRALLAFPDTVLKLVDTHDIFSDRDQAIQRATGLKSHWLSATAAAEAEGLNRAHRVLGIQAEESDHLRSMTQAHVTTVGHFIDGPSPAQATPAPGSPGTILFVGSESAINRHGIIWFIHNVLPELASRLPGARLRVVGKVANAMDAELKGMDGVDLVGPVDDLAAEYAGASVVINPVLFGTGLAIKSIEALSHGKALLCTSLGARGVRLQRTPEQPMLVADEPSSFAAVLLQVLQDPKLRQDLEAKARAFIGAWNHEQLDGLKQAFSVARDHSVRAPHSAPRRP